jgi:hypothetical protein
MSEGRRLVECAGNFVPYLCGSMVIPPESPDIRGFPYLDAQKGERPGRRAERLVRFSPGKPAELRWAK